MHYQRQRHTGRLDAVTHLDRFLAKVEKLPEGRGSCWIWRGFINANGYGQFGAGDIVHLAHRWMWIQTNGEIPSNEPHLDHLCRVRACVNPDHLEPVTQAENNRRSWLYRPRPIPMERCGRGHDMDEANRYPRGDRPGRFACRKCSAINQKAYADRKQVAS
jgi:hypothetical protein